MDTPLPCEEPESGERRALERPVLTRQRARGVGPNAPLRQICALEVALW
jgi:hypothetical protein